MASEAYTKINGMWRSSAPYIKVSGTWKQPDTIYQKISGSWKVVWGTEQVTYKEFGFCPYKSSPSSEGNLYGFLGSTSCNKIYGSGWSGVRDYNGDLIFDDHELYQPDEFGLFYYPVVGEICTVVFSYPPTGGQSGKRVYILCSDGLRTYSYEIVNANKINAGSYKLYFNGSTFSIVT